MMGLKSLTALIVAIAALAAAFVFSTKVQAQDDSYVDLSIEAAEADFTVRNHGTVTAYGVTVDIELADQTTTDSRFSSATCSGNIPGTTCASGVWHVGRLGPGEEATTTVVARLASGLPCCPSSGQFWSVPRRGVVKSAFQEDVSKSNNAATGWVVRRQSAGVRSAETRYTLTEASVDELLPDPGDTVNFRFDVTETGPAFYGAKLRLKLDNGLGTPTAAAPAGTTFGAATGLTRTWDWNLGTAGNIIGVSTTLDNPLPAGVARSDLCLTAELTARGENLGVGGEALYTSAEICLREDPVVLLEEGEATLFGIYPCVGVTAYPCSDDDTIEMRVIGGSAARVAGIARDEAVLRPERVFVQVKDPEGRRIDTHSDSVNSGTAPSWHTARPAHADLGDGRTGVGGTVDVRYTHRVFTTQQRANYSQLDLTAVVAGLDGTAAPELVNIRFPGTGDAEFKPRPSQTNESSYFDVDTAKYQSLVEFSTLGTYKLDYTAAVTHTDTTAYPNPISGTGSYTFHVGPVAELEAQDGGANPGVQLGGRAFTIRAINHGPDDAPAVRAAVTGLNARNYVSHSASAGSFDPGIGVWTIGELRESGFYQDVHGRDGEELTIVTSAAADSEIRAAISNTQDYQVCIDSSGDDVAAASRSSCTGTSGNTWHTTKYFDYISDNNTATIAARAGLAGGAPDTRPGMVGSLPMGGANLVFWSEPQSGGEHQHFGPVRSWDIEYSEDGGSEWSPLRYRHSKFGGSHYYVDRNAPDSTRQYRVRARYDERAGEWTAQGESVAQTTASGDPGVSVRPESLTVARAAGAATASGWTRGPRATW